MCGIAGIYSYHGGSVSIDRKELDLINEYQVRRGPDVGGYWYSECGTAAFAHRRLAIIDLHEDANQPMMIPEEGLAIVFNGEIYNYRELRQELAAAGRSFKTQSDTEVLLQGYAEWGDSVLSRLRGMYAFAIWDNQKKRLFLARDPYGIKPIYFAHDGKFFRFASQVKAILAGGKVSKAPSPEGVTGFLMMGSVPEPYTVYQNIFSVPSGCYMYVDSNGVSPPQSFFSVSKVWRQAADSPLICQPCDFQSLVTAALVDSIRHHTIADVPVGAFLSAGIDSGAVVGLMREQQTSDIQSITLGFDEFRGSQNDETVLSSQVAERYGTRHITRWVVDEEVERDLPTILTAMDQPSVDGVNTWLVSKAAHEAGLKVVLSGVGGDELFGGYSHFDVLPKWKKEQALLRKVPGAAMIGEKALLFAARYGLAPAKAAALVRYGASYAGLYLAKRGLFMPWELTELLGEEFAIEGLAALQPPEFIVSSIGGSIGNGYASIAALEANFYLRNQLLRDSDWASMAHSLELRTPLVDSTLLTALAPALVNRPQGMGKKLALAAAPRKALPISVVNRPKTGFSLPMDRWLKSTSVLDSWRRIPSLSDPKSHWSRRLAYSLVSDLL
ncbi:asparagine synthase (glutamine-hydrolyzing) [Haliea sp. E1-2-M8]|uniref:asparagine synthase (glutamine-hydrolyzing) n=1 Tax=Haliea sp. E1-2-M8 TaxID=3064706 RepID=UPI0027276D66|nr:asparagine synthase (glutamine-hydrolyzing) [Haliea sp. E1-2-M8]MDO8861668.1 asparagine synthase (glutamine-hydrolyzing) [Haliea sp. E1-2-M8]